MITMSNAPLRMRRPPRHPTCPPLPHTTTTTTTTHPLHAPCPHAACPHPSKRSDVHFNVLAAIATPTTCALRPPHVDRTIDGVPTAHHVVSQMTLGLRSPPPRRFLHVHRLDVCWTTATSPGPPSTSPPPWMLPSSSDVLPSSTTSLHRPHTACMRRSIDRRIDLLSTTQHLVCTTTHGRRSPPPPRFVHDGVVSTSPELHHPCHRFGDRSTQTPFASRHRFRHVRVLSTTSTSVGPQRRRLTDNPHLHILLPPLPASAIQPQCNRAASSSSIVPDGAVLEERQGTRSRVDLQVSFRFLVFKERTDRDTTSFIPHFDVLAGTARRSNDRSPFHHRPRPFPNDTGSSVTTTTTTSFHQRWCGVNVAWPPLRHPLNAVSTTLGPSPPLQRCTDHHVGASYPRSPPQPPPRVVWHDGVVSTWWHIHEPHNRYGNCSPPTPFRVLSTTSTSFGPPRHWLAHRPTSIERRQRVVQ
jgi:hypothetical protein